jgi:hypothetical protein
MATAVAAATMLPCCHDGRISHPSNPLPPAPLTLPPHTDLFDAYGEDIDAFMLDAFRIPLPRSTLDALTALYDLTEQQQERQNAMQQYNALKAENLFLQASLKRMREDFELLNHEHIQLANSHTHARLAVEQLTRELEEGRERLQGLQAVLAQDRAYAEHAVQGEMEELVVKNLGLTNTIVELSDRVAELEEQLGRLTFKRDESRVSSPTSGPPASRS